ncbi:MAG: prolyl oligopeptidase family serine peptidase [Thermoanaerobaculaceae bacterium]|jgi:dipeptidyl aminopeptidase/acylaminoacyl peptidase|nr:prolyl oligopeptidase family serine peptidase [Thermoanaerobaculaceae bacterium]
MRRLAAVGVLGLLLVAASAGAGGKDAVTGAEAAATAWLALTGADGAIESLRLIIRTEHSEYFALTYWSDELRVKGFLGRPREGTCLPAVIYNRGGNLEYGALKGWEIIPYVEAGFVAVASQYRGNGGGEGREQFGGADVDDVMNLLPLLKGLPEVDPERIGMTGNSRGGMMTYLALKRQTLTGTHDIKAAVTIGGVADLFGWLDERPSMIDTFRALIRGWPDKGPYRARSAVEWPELINVPLLILHGESDDRVSVEQSRRLAELLTKAGKPVQLITYPGDDHSLSVSRSGLVEGLAWFGHYLGMPGEDSSLERHGDAMQQVLSTWPGSAR